MNPPFPKEAEPVRQKIRESVERPKELPELVSTLLTFKVGPWCPALMCWDELAQWRLPLEGSPRNSFTHWWDGCTEAQEAVDTVWGKES